MGEEVEENRRETKGGNARGEMDAASAQKQRTAKNGGSDALLLAN